MDALKEEYWKIPIWRLIAGLLFFFIMGNAIHECGHIVVGLMQGRTIYSATFFGTGAITYMSTSADPISNVLVDFAGTATLPIFLMLYKGMLGKFYKYEMEVIIVIWVVSFLMGTDLKNILAILLPTFLLKI
jgi:hypothetical protein